MKLLIKNHSYLFENSEEGTIELINKINSILESENDFFSHLVIDGIEIYEDHEEYILDHLEEVEEIVVITKTIKEFVNSLLISLHDYTKRGIPEIERIIDGFYQNPSEESWHKLGQLLGGIEWIYESIKTMDKVNHQIPNWQEFIKSIATFEVELSNLLEAMENKDMVLIADIIQYEILPQFQLINRETEKLFEVK